MRMPTFEGFTTEATLLDGTTWPVWVELAVIATDDCELSENTLDIRAIRRISPRGEDLTDHMTFAEYGRVVGQAWREYDRYTARLRDLVGRIMEQQACAASWRLSA